MPAPEWRNSRRVRPWRVEARSAISARRAAYWRWSSDWGGGTNSSFEAIRAGIGGRSSASASRSHWRIHMGGAPSADNPLFSGNDQRFPRDTQFPIHHACVGDTQAVAPAAILIHTLGRVLVWLQHGGLLIYPDAESQPHALVTGYVTRGGP